ncbi:MAG: transcriptional repressor [Desulfatibacillaceae bacterium]|nr:transcriptional repressor [Desulfatibacillaceae bacterium]
MELLAKINSNSHHSQEEGQFARLFEEEGIDRVDERLAVLRIFLETEEHITAHELWELVQKAGRNFEPEFVRETLRLMCRYGFAQRREFKDRESVYEHRHLGQHHDHIICIKCGKIEEFVDEKLERHQARAAYQHGFYMLQHRMEIYGLCSDCLSDHQMGISLVQAKPGESLVVMDFLGGAGARHRLMTMGLKIGDKIEVITNDGRGQVVLAKGNSRFALGQGLAEKVMVKALTSEPEDF